MGLEVATVSENTFLLDNFVLVRQSIVNPTLNTIERRTLSICNWPSCQRGQRERMTKVTSESSRVSHKSVRIWQKSVREKKNKQQTRAPQNQNTTLDEKTLLFLFSSWAAKAREKNAEYFLLFLIH